MAIQFLNPDEILKDLNLHESMSAADFGCGSGGWVLPLAKILNKGMVFAIDILKEPLSALESRRRSQKIPNIKAIVSDVEEEKGSTLRPSSVDLVLITNLLFQVEDKEHIFQEAKRVLKEEGKVLVVDWKENAPMGPAGKKVSPDEVKKTAQDSGFKFEKKLKAGDYHYCLVFEK